MYELMVIVKKDFPSDNEGKVKELLSTLTGGATIESVSVIGKKKLAYQIAGNTEGIYILSEVSATVLTNTVIQNAVKMQNDTIRFLLTTKGR